MKKFWAVVGIVFALGLVLVLILTIFAVFLVVGKHIMPGAEEVAVVNIVGEIHRSKSVIDLLHEYEGRPRVKAIVLRIDSPGGGVAATQEIYEEVNKIREKGKKPIIASLGSVAASGGYYVACGAEKIVANPGTLTGSIGVLMNIVNMEELLKKIGIEMKSITSGEFKDIGSISRELTPDEEKLLREVIDNIQGQFLRVIEERRGLTGKELESIADARIFTGEQALEKQLIDELGNLNDAIEIAARAAGIEGEPRIVEEKKRFSLLQLILGKTELSLSPLHVRYGIQ
jgi:protease-4